MWGFSDSYYDIGYSRTTGCKQISQVNQICMANKRKERMEFWKLSTCMERAKEGELSTGAENIRWDKKRKWQY